MGTGDILIENKRMLQDNEPVLIVSWRSIPDADTLMTFLNNPVQLASILASGTIKVHPKPVLLLILLHIVFLKPIHLLFHHQSNINR